MTEARDVYNYKPEEDVLERRWLHKMLVGLDRPNAWPAWLVAVVVIVLIALVAFPWWFGAGPAWAGGMVLCLGLCVAADWAVLRTLPRRRISFGSVRPQAFLLFLPRWVVVVSFGLLARWLPAATAFTLAAGINVLAGLALFWGAHHEPAHVRVSRITLPAAAHPADARPLTILHISDLHIERLGRREEQILELAQSLQPDLILCSGDYINLSCVEDPEAHAAARSLLGQLHAPAGVFAVLGSPPVDRCSAPDFDDLPARLLRNELVTIDLEDGRRITLLGLDCAHDPDLDGAHLAELARQAPADAYRVLLYHSPDLMPVAPAHGIDLYLAGHTHGGQVRLPLFGALMTSSRYGKRFEMGHYVQGKTHLYVSRGIGLEGLGAPRVRFLCPPEVVFFSLDGAGGK